MTKLRILGQDPAFSNYGLALVEVDVLTKEMTPIWIKLIETSKSNNKQVRSSSDKLQRAVKINGLVREAEGICNLIAAEIPSGAQSAAAANGLGIALGVVAGHTKPLIEVSPAEAKRAATGYSDASKFDMVSWAYDLWPNLDWFDGAKGKKPAFVMSDERGLANKNEHMADALAIVKAATLTPEFDQMAVIASAMAA